MGKNKSLRSFNRVMLIDDNFIDNFVHKKLLESLKISNNAIEFTIPQKAIEYLKLFNCFSPHPNKNHIDLILLDINMPEMDGWGFIEEYKKACNNKTPQTIIIVLSSSANRSDIERCQDEPFLSGFIQKPLTMEKLSNCLGSIRPAK